MKDKKQEIKKTDSEFYEELKAISSLLTDAKNYGLESEVVHMAIRTMKENPDYSIEQAALAARLEWDI